MIIKDDYFIIIINGEILFSQFLKIITNDILL